MICEAISAGTLAKISCLFGDINIRQDDPFADVHDGRPLGLKKILAHATRASNLQLGRRHCHCQFAKFRWRLPERWAVGDCHRWASHRCLRPVHHPATGHLFRRLRKFLHWDLGWWWRLWHFWLWALGFAGLSRSTQNLPGRADFGGTAFAPKALRLSGLTGEGRKLASRVIV